MKRKKTTFIIYFLIFLEIVLILIELILNLKGTTLCQNYECKTLDQLIKIDRKYFLSLGLVYFVCLLISFYLYIQTKGSLFRLIFLLLLGGGVTAELIFFFRQLAEANIFCYFCLVITLLFFLILIFSLLVLTYPFSLAELSFFILGISGGIAFSFYLTTINPNPLLMSQTQNRFSLIYSENCPNCKEIIEIFKNKKIHLNLIQVSNAYPLMKKLNLNYIPILIYQKSENNLEFLSGRDQILELLRTLDSETNPQVKSQKNFPKLYQSLKNPLKKKSNLPQESCEDEFQGVCEVK